MSETNGDMSELPKGWEWKTLGEVAQVVGGSTPKSKESAYWDGKIPWLAVSDLTGYENMYISGGARSITQAGFVSCATQMLPKGSVVFSSRAPIGYVAIAANDLCTSQGFKSFVLKKELDPEYVYWYLKSAKDLAESLASGTTFKELSGKRAAAIPIPIPPSRGEQREIAQLIERLFTRLEDGVERLGEASKLRMALREHVLNQASVGQGTMRPLADCLSEPFINGRSVRTADDGFPVLRLTALKEGTIDLAEAKIGAWTAEEARPYLVSAGDFLVARGNGSLRLVGRGGVVPNEPRPIAFPDTLIRVRVDSNVVNTNYLRLVWDSRLVRSQIERQARTTAGIYKINQSDLGNLEIPTPPLRDQAVIVSETRSRLTELDALEAQLGDIGSAEASLRRSVLRKAFGGTLQRKRKLTL